MSAAPVVGGQAVIEGVMMRRQNRIAIAVRKPDQQLSLYEETITTISEKYPLFKLPLLRGMAAFIESLLLGTRALTLSAAQAAVEEEEELTGWQLTLTVGTALLIAVGLFFLLPTVVMRFVSGFITAPPLLLNLLEGLLRLTIFLVYLLLVSRLPDIQRVFQYHGAEHKAVACFEAGEELTVANARKYSPLHPRCGTSFLLLVMTVSIVFFSLFGWPDSIVRRLTIRLALLPLVAGFSYELIRLAGRYRFFCYLTAPGLWLQRLTTREPDDQQLAVALHALRAVVGAANEHEV
ncbi:MAG: DUF1385 domain-containing protein [Dethiobacteraceae bacterium]|jgi:uncharacterized protein YqhQ|nr:DUF1385 domain-containing protein [Bacillota bacterium]